MISPEGQLWISNIIREISKGKLEVGIMNGSILVVFLMRSKIQSKVILSIVEAILNALRTILHNYEFDL